MSQILFVALAGLVAVACESSTTPQDDEPIALEIVWDSSMRVVRADVPVHDALQSLAPEQDLWLLGDGIAIPYAVEPGAALTMVGVQLPASLPAGTVLSVHSRFDEFSELGPKLADATVIDQSLDVAIRPFNVSHKHRICRSTKTPCNAGHACSNENHDATGCGTSVACRVVESPDDNCTAATPFRHEKVCTCSRKI